ncbi:Retrovirus-related Pol polyprotein from transposon RE1-like protein [Drosera capensis]
MESFLMSYGFIGFVDGSVVSLPMHFLQASSAPVLNPDYFQWQRIDQMVRSWIFVTLSRDILVEILNLKLAREIWDRLHHRFMSVCMATSMELKRKLTSLCKASSDSMEKYLRDIKILAGSLATINSPVSNADLIKHTLMGLGTEYKSLIAMFMNASITPSFDDIRSKLLLHEQRLKLLSSAYLPQHQAFAAAPRSSGGRGRFKGGGSGGRSSQSQSRRGSFPGQSVEAFTTGLTGGSNEAVWYPDSGASSHMTNIDDSDWAGCPDNARSTTASYLVLNPILHARSKHVVVDYHFVRERVSYGDLVVRYVPTHLQLADIFTKALSSDRKRRRIKGEIDSSQPRRAEIYFWRWIWCFSFD